jgi:hypothetical protein
MKHIKQRLVLKYKILVCRARMLFRGQRMTDREIDRRLENVTR